MNWRAIQKTNIRKIVDLEDFLGLKLETGNAFPLNLPLRLAHKIEPHHNDPILLQFVPKESENLTVEGFTLDPVADGKARQKTKLLHKYSGRALLVTTGACAMHCRYCFRQNFDYKKSDFNQELDYLRSDPSIHEVILSGGDPLSLSDEKLAALIEQLDAIPHLRLIRFHSRFPVGIPERITPEFTSIIANMRLQGIFVVHINHPRELDSDVTCALRKIGLPLLNQSVLLAGVNDNLETLKELSLKLSENGILPYYLHQLDRVKGTHHFEVPVERGLQLIEQMRLCLPGYCVPRYVQENPGEKSKTPLHLGKRIQTQDIKALFHHA